jgi:hypothetical protein
LRIILFVLLVVIIHVTLFSLRILPFINEGEGVRLSYNTEEQQTQQHHHHEGRGGVEQQTQQQHPAVRVHAMKWQGEEKKKGFVDPKLENSSS